MQSQAMIASKLPVVSVQVREGETISVSQSRLSGMTLLAEGGWFDVEAEEKVLDLRDLDFEFVAVDGVEELEDRF